MIEELAFETLCNGAVLEQVNEAIRRCVDNLTDWNYPQSGKRTVTVQLAFATLENRQRPLVQPSVTLKLAERVLPPQFVTVNVVTKEAQIESLEQQPLFHEDFPFTPDWVPTLGEINRGEVLREINLGIGKAVESIADPDAPLNGKRVVTTVLQFSLDPKGDRRNRIVFSSPGVTTKLPPRAINDQTLELAPVGAGAEYPLYDQTRKGNETNA